MVTGSVAASNYAPPRSTRDLDVVVEVGPEDADRLCDLFEHDFYLDREAVRQALERRGTFNLIHYDLVVKVDFIVRGERDYDAQAFQRRRLIAVGDRKVSVASPEDLILSKLVWARESRSELQLRDVRDLARGAANLDRGYLETWAARLGISDLYRETCG